MLLGAFLGLILIGCSKEEKIEQPAVDVKSQYQENIQKKVDLAKSEIRIVSKMHDTLRTYASEEILDSGEFKDFNDKMLDESIEYSEFVQNFFDMQYNK